MNIAVFNEEVVLRMAAGSGILNIHSLEKNAVSLSKRNWSDVLKH